MLAMNRMENSMSDTPANPGAAPGVDDFLCFAVYSAGHAFNRVYKPVLEALGLTYPQYLVMVSLWAKDDQTVGSLGEKLFLESSTLTPLLKRLDAMGYLTRSRDPSDERQVRVRLTKTGAALRAKARDVPKCILEATGLSAAALHRLQNEISAVRASLLKQVPG
jgi:DNA-binding MarR family transcriptional regulator